MRLGRKLYLWRLFKRGLLDVTKANQPIRRCSGCIQVCCGPAYSLSEGPLILLACKQLNILGIDRFRLDQNPPSPLSRYKWLTKMGKSFHKRNRSISTYEQCVFQRTEASVEKHKQIAAFFYHNWKTAVFCCFKIVRKSQYDIAKFLSSNLTRVRRCI